MFTVTKEAIASRSFQQIKLKYIHINVHICKYIRERDACLYVYFSIKNHKLITSNSNPISKGSF